MTPAERMQKAFDFAQDVTKQFITLATAILAVTITFLTDAVLKTDATGKSSLKLPEGSIVWLERSWIVYIISIGFGVLTLMAMTGNLAAANNPSPYAGLVRAFAILQILSFGVAAVFTITFGFKAI